MSETALNADQWVAAGDHVEVFGHKIFMHRTGPKSTSPTYLFLHGFPTWSLDWQYQINDLSKDHDCLALDFLGFGYSDKPISHFYKMEEQADIVVDVLRQKKVTNIILVAHDYATTVALLLLGRQNRSTLPFTIKKLVLMNGGLLDGFYRPNRLQKLLLSKLTGPLLSRAMTKSLAFRGLGKVFSSQNPLTRPDFDQLWQGMSRQRGHLSTHGIIQYIKERRANLKTWEEALEETTIPLHFIWGPEDQISGKHLLDEARRRFQTAQFTELDGISHYPMLEAPEKVASALRGF